MFLTRKEEGKYIEDWAIGEIHSNFNELFLSFQMQVWREEVLQVALFTQPNKSR